MQLALWMPVAREAGRRKKKKTNKSMSCEGREAERESVLIYLESEIDNWL